MTDDSTKVEISIGEISHIEGMLAIGGDVVAGNKTIIQYIIQQVAKKILSQPYKFLSSYEISDKDIFFGREALTEQLVGKVFRHKVLLINGASGSGKSSLINAGLIPRLAENGYTYLSFRDYSDPLRQLQQCLIDTKLLPTADLQAESLLQTIQAFKQRQIPTVFIFDQFERFFVNVPTLARPSFIEMIKACMENLQPTEMNVIFSMREEFFGQFQREFEKIIRAFLNECERINIEQLSKAEARAAIVRPLTLIETKIGYDETFVDEVLLAGLEAETREQKGISPSHLQIVCNQLYQAAHKQLEHQQWIMIDAKLYEQLGGAQTILRTYLDDCVNTVAGNNKTHIKVLRSLLKQMIATVGTRKFVTIEQLTTTLPEVPPQEIQTLLGCLQDARVIETRLPEPFYSLSHEFMVAKVKDWYDEREIERKKAEETLEHGLAEWQNSGALLNKKQVVKIRTFVNKLSEPAQQLLRESEQALRESEQTLRESEQTYQARNGLIVSLLAVIMLAIGFGIFSYLKVREAKLRQLFQLDALAVLAAEAPNSSNGHFDRALLLAAEAFKRKDNLETRGTLLRVMNSADRNYLVAYLHGHSDSVTSVAFSPDGKTLASGSKDKTVILWEVDTRKPSKLQGHSGSVRSIAFSPDGKMLASGSEDNIVRLWDVDTRKPSELQGHSGPVTSVAFSPDGKMLASGSEDKTVILWDVTSRTPIESPLQGHSGSVKSIAFSPDGKMLASGSDDNTVRLWDVDTRQSSELQGDSGPVTSVAFSSDGKMLASGSRDKTIRLWNVANRTQIESPLQGHSKGVTNVAFSPDGKMLASSSWDKTIRLWDVTSRTPIGLPLQGHSKGVTNVAFSPDGKMLASSSWDKTVILWKVDKHKLFEDLLLKQSDSVNSVAFSPDGKTASSSKDKTVHLWDVATQTQFGSPLQHSSFVNSVAFSPDGKLASGSKDKTIRLWDVTSRTPIGSLQGHSKGVTNVAFSPDGKMLASSSRDKTVILWEVATQKQVESRLPQSSFVSRVAFSADGKTLAASSSGDKTIFLWNDVDPQSWDEKACRIAGRNLTLQEWQNSVGDNDYQKTCEKAEYPSGEALALIEEGERLAAKAKPQDIEAAKDKFNQAFLLDPSLKEHPLYKTLIQK